MRQYLNSVKKWPLILVSLFVWGYVVTRWVHDTEFLAGFWGITNDEIAVVTIEKDSSNSGDNSTETIIIQDPSKSFWDGLQLLGVPLVLAVLGAWFQQSQRKQDADEAREEVLQLYFDRVSALLVDKNLMAIASKGDEAPSESKELLEASLDVIRARTLSILRRFDKDIDRKSSVIRFLAEAEIISKLKLDLSRACLQGVKLMQANLQGAKLLGADLRGVNLQKVNLQGADLRGVKLMQANLWGTYLQGAGLQTAHLQGADLRWADLEGAKLYKAKLMKAKLYKAKLMKANLQEVNLQQAKLQLADLMQANLQRASLHEANLQGAYLLWADLMQANLQGTDLHEANLYEANLQWAKLHKANLQGTDLQRADLWGADLWGADLSNIHFDSETIWPAKEEVTKAINIPSELKKQLGLIPKPSQATSPAQHPPEKPQ